MPTAFCQAGQNPLFPLTAILPWVILFRKRNQSTLLVTQNTLPLSFAGRVSKLKKESLLQALIKMYMLTSCKLFYTNFCARNQFLFRIKRLSKFLYRCFEIWAFHSLKQQLVIKHTVVSIYTKHKFIVTAWIASAINAKDRDVTTQANPTFSLTQIIRAFWLTQSCVGKSICSCEVTIFCGARTIYAITIHLRYAWLPTTVLTNERLISRSICTQILITFLYETRTLSSSLICRSPHSSCIPTI